ncbi:MAG: glycosyltransferase [Tepidisphaeraceae bacterium]
MNYLIVNHIPAHAGKDPAHLVVPRRWLNELQAQGGALHQVGMRLMVATPVAPRDAAAPENDDVEINPADVGFEHVATLGYDSARSYLANRAELARQLREAVNAADVVQLDDGGHPVPVGLEANDAATEAKRKRVWVFGREDPTDRLRLINLARRAAKRFVGHTVTRNMASRLADAVRDADLVLAHSARVQKRFAEVWNPQRCHLIDRMEVHEHEMLDAASIEARRELLMQQDRPLRLLAAGRQVAISGTDHVLRAVAKCRRLHVPVELTVAGDGQDLDFFRSLAWQLGLETGVHFVQERDAVTQAWREADLLVSGALSDVIPREVVLAVARGLTPIMYASTEAADGHGDGLIGDERYGEAILTVARGDADRLADRLVRAAGQRTALVQRMFKGLAWMKPRTIEATHRTRAAMVRNLIQ